MGIQTLGIANLPVARAEAAAPARVAEPQMVEMGTSGTAVFGQGYVRELGEYNSEFSGGPFSAYRIWEQMRRGDAQVAATLMAMKLPVRCGEWKIQPPDDATPAEKECADLAEENLLEDLDFDRSIENLLLAVDFGCACHEDVWTNVNGQLRLKRLAPRLPLTFYRWITDDNEQLKVLVQRGFHGGNYQEFPLPADKIALYTFRREGGNFAGRAILREMYQHWYTKSALYKIDAIAAERNGMGVPVGEMAPGATAEDKKKFEMFLRQVAAHQSAFVSFPSGYKFTLQGVVGQVRDCWKSIEHHNMQLCMAGLAQFLIMGQTAGGSGNRSLGETMSDFFYLAEQTLADQVGDCLSLNSLTRLAAYNYGPTCRPPKLVPQQIMALKFEAIVDALQKLGTAKFLTWDPDMETWAREKMGAPATEKAELLRWREKATVSVNRPDAAGQAPGDAGDDGSEGGSGGNAPGSEGGRQNAKSGVSSDDDVEASRGGVEIDGMKLRRAPRGAEKCLALSRILGALDKGRDAVAAALRAGRSRVQAGVVHKLIAAPLQKAHQVSLAIDEKLVADVEAVLRGIYEFGFDQVGEERARQMGGQAPADAATIRAAASRRKGDPIGLYADAVVSEFQNDLTARAARVTLDLKRRQGDKTDGEVFRAVEEELDGQSDKWVDSVAGKGTNEAFADGRADGYEEHADDIKGVIYSALLDINTCEACAEADGAEGATPDDVPDVPNPDCDGGDKCRCVHVYVFADEGKAVA